MREETEDIETNQQVIGLKYLFQRFSIKAWSGTCFRDNNHTAYNIIVNNHCMNYYCKCWKDRNKKIMMKILKEK